VVQAQHPEQTGAAAVVAAAAWNLEGPTHAEMSARFQLDIAVATVDVVVAVVVVAAAAAAGARWCPMLPPMVRSRVATRCPSPMR